VAVCRNAKGLAAPLVPALSGIGALAIVPFVLMRRYARLDPPELGGHGDEFSLPAVEY
jgi:hypothetical protein